MVRIFLTCLLGGLLFASQVLALELTSLAPERGTPGTLVIIGGGPFSPDARLELGEFSITPLRSNKNFLEFAVPAFPPGTYTLTVRDGGERAARSYPFEVMAPTPQIAAINPRNLDVCREEVEDVIEVNGRNFQPGAIVLVNDLVVPSTRINAELIEAQIDAFRQPGVLGVSVRNPDGAVSLPFSLWIDGIPEITSVERGGEFVNYYEVIIHGRNFQINSTLVVKEPEESTVGEAYRQLSFVPRSGSGAVGLNDVIAPQRNRLIFQDCRTLIYHRYPSNFQGKSLKLRVLNPDGSKTDQHTVDLP